ncbi:MAG: SDR family oxidoreductase [Lentisphaerae bacterium]|nr:SDR family oxidoreductase [Lentisphaerota bacterium]
MSKRLENKVCAITGAGQGIGEAGAKLFAAEGAYVFVLELNEAAGKKCVADILAAGGKAEFIQTDVSNGQSVAAAFAEIMAKAGTLDVLYNNASVYLNGKDGIITDIDPEVWHRVLAINLDSVFYCSREALKIMTKNGKGSIINTASSAGVVGIPRCDAYTATKGATVALTRSMASEYGPYGIRVNCIAPAAIATAMIKESNPDDDYFDPNYFIKVRTPLRRWGSAEEVAELALFLASDASSYINGTIIAADGGITINGDLAKAK